MDDIEWTLGILLAAGHDPDHLLDRYSFTQLATYARCTVGHHLRMLDMLVRPVLASQGVDYKGSTIDRPGPSAPRTSAQEEAREHKLIAALAASPFGIRTVKTSGQDGDSQG